MPVLQLVFWVALLGLVTSLTIHVCALLGLELFPSSLLSILGIGLFLTIVPASCLAGLEDKSVTIREHYNRIRKVLADCPAIMRYATILLFLYGIANIIAGLDFSFGTTQEMPHSIGRIRSFSAVLAAFYAVAATVWYSVIQGRKMAGPQDAKTLR